MWEREVVCLQERLEPGLRGGAAQSRKCVITAEAAAYGANGGWSGGDTETMSPVNEPANDKHAIKNSLLFVVLDVHAQNITAITRCQKSLTDPYRLLLPLVVRDCHRG